MTQQTMEKFSEALMFGGRVFWLGLWTAMRVTFCLAVCLDLLAALFCGIWCVLFPPVLLYAMGIAAFAPVAGVYAAVGTARVLALPVGAVAVAATLWQFLSSDPRPTATAKQPVRFVIAKEPHYSALEVPSSAHCPVCATGILGIHAVCPDCETPHHAACWKYTGQCARYGCGNRKSSTILQRALPEIGLESPGQEFHP